MSFSEAEKVDVRRFCFYPAYGAGASGFMGFRFFQSYGTLEFRLNNLDPTEETVIRTTYLANLYTLENAIPTVTSNQDTASAGPWVRNPAELMEREALFDGWRLRLCAFLGIPPGPAFSGGGTSIIV